MRTFSGLSSNGLPYARLSDKGPALVIFTGSELEHVPPTKMTQQGFLVGLRQMTQQYAVYPFT